MGISPDGKHIAVSATSARSAYGTETKGRLGASGVPPTRVSSQQPASSKMAGSSGVSLPRTTLKTPS